MVKSCIKYRTFDCTMFISRFEAFNFMQIKGLMVQSRDRLIYDLAAPSSHSLRCWSQGYNEQLRRTFTAFIVSSKSLALLDNREPIVRARLSNEAGWVVQILFNPMPSYFTPRYSYLRTLRILHLYH